MEQQLSRIQTIRKVHNFESDEQAGEMWSLPIGWNRKINPLSGLADEPLDERFLSNEIRTAKYTRLNFIPYNLLHQLSKGPNIYYLAICALQMIQPISITNGSPTNVPPLVFLIIVSMIKDCFEDSRRSKSDSVENNRDTTLIEA